MTPRIKFFQQLKAFYEEMWHGTNDLSPCHVSLYFFLVNQNNRNGWAEWFKVPLDLGMKGSCIGTKRTYYSAMDDLANWGYIKYEKGVNEWKAPKVSIVPLSSNGKTVPDMPEVEVLKSTASVTATSTATTPQVLPLPSPLPIPLPSPLEHPDKDYKTNTRPLDLRQERPEGGARNVIDWDAVEERAERKTAELRAKGIII